jgi:hypothetical protein
MHTLSENKQVFLNPDCELTGTCDLKRFVLTTSVYETWFSDDAEHPTYGNGAIIEYETDSVAAIENYAVVQFKRGCVFDRWKNGSGKISTGIAYTVSSFGEEIPFCFPHWVIDSQDADPAYNSDPARGRYYLLRWNKHGSYDSRTQTFYGEEKPARPVVYMTDYPAGAFVTATGVKNVALEFKTCIFKSSDVPRQTRRDNVRFATPLSCFDWRNVYVYDFETKTFETEIAELPQWPEPAGPAAPLTLVWIVPLIAVVLVTFSLAALSLSRKQRRFGLGAGNAAR